jgi:hypothetical protein
MSVLASTLVTRIADAASRSMLPPASKPAPLMSPLAVARSILPAAASAVSAMPDAASAAIRSALSAPSLKMRPSETS